MVLILVLCVLCDRLLICLGTGAAGGCFATVVLWWVICWFCWFCWCGVGWAWCGLLALWLLLVAC